MIFNLPDELLSLVTFKLHDNFYSYSYSEYKKIKSIYNKYLDITFRARKDINLLNCEKLNPHPHYYIISNILKKSIDYYFLILTHYNCSTLSNNFRVINPYNAICNGIKKDLSFPHIVKLTDLMFCRNESNQGNNTELIWNLVGNNYKVVNFLAKTFCCLFLEYPFKNLKKFFEYFEVEKKDFKYIHKRIVKMGMYQTINENNPACTSYISKMAEEKDANYSTYYMNHEFYNVFYLYYVGYDDYIKKELDMSYLCGSNSSKITDYNKQAFRLLFFEEDLPILDLVFQKKFDKIELFPK